MRKFARAFADGLAATFGPIYVPRWLHHGVWVIVWTIWIVGSVGFICERLGVG